jgi:hypothetical protein
MAGEPEKSEDPKGSLFFSISTIDENRWFAIQELVILSLSKENFTPGES